MLDLSLTYFEAKQEVSTPGVGNAQKVTNTGFFLIGDTVDVVEYDANGCAVNVIAAGATVSGLCPNAELILDSSVDTTGLAGTPYIVNRSVECGQTALERFYNNYAEVAKRPFQLTSDILSHTTNTPSVGQMLVGIPDASCWGPGDPIQLICDGQIVLDTTINAVNSATNVATLNASADLSSFTSCKLVAKSLSIAKLISRIKSSTSALPVDPEAPTEGLFGNCKSSVFTASQVFVGGSSKLYLDGRKAIKGTAGTRATLSNGASDAQLSFTSNILGINGNSVQVEMLDPAAPSEALTVSVTGSFPDCKVSVSLATDGVSALSSTAQDVADAINADPMASRVLMAIYGGSGTGIQAALTATNLSGGLNDGSGNYAELEQVSGNEIVGTGHKLVSLWIGIDTVPGKNGIKRVPRDTQTVEIEYRI